MKKALLICITFLFGSQFIYAQPEIDIEGNTTSIPDGDITPSLGDDSDFGSVSIGAAPSNTFTIQNEGTSDLTLSGGPTFVTLSGSSLFTVTAQPSSPISAAGSATFTIQFTASCPNTAGTYNATVSVSSDDADESPYTFDIMADITGVDTDSDGALDLCDSDDDNDGILDGSDPDDTDFNICGDSDADGCDDCSVTNGGFGALSDSDPLNDGPDADCDGICDATDPTDNAQAFRGRMLTFNGGGDYVSIGDVPQLNFEKVDDFTVEAWINSSSPSTAMQIVSKYEGDLFNATGWGLQISGSSVAFYLAGGSLFDFMLSVPTGSPNVKDGLWHHVAVVYDGSNNVTGCTFYIDGVAYAGIDGGGTVASVAGSTLNSESAAIGAYIGTISGSAEYWDGSLEEVRVWDDQRTQTEIRENLHLSLAGACDPSLDGYWKFNEVSGATSFDLSGNGNDGTHNGAPLIALSQASVSGGLSTTHSATATATTYSSASTEPNHSLDISFATTPPGGEIVVTYMQETPVGGPPAAALVNYSVDHWIVNNYGPTNAGLDAELLFKYADGGITSVSLATYNLHKRGSRETGAWTLTNTFANLASTIPGNNYVGFSPTTDFSMFFPSSSVSPLPVGMVSFEARPIGTIASLTWATASETNNVGFDVERSADSKNWMKIGFVEGQGTHIGTTNYSLNDRTPIEGKNYYRLKQIDMNGDYTYTDVRMVQFTNTVEDILVYPNPNKGEFSIVLKGFEQDNISLSIIDINGREVFSEALVSEAKSAHVKLISLDDVQAGIYYITATDGLTIKKQKIVVR